MGKEDDIARQKSTILVRDATSVEISHYLIKDKKELQKWLGDGSFGNLDTHDDSIEVYEVKFIGHIKATKILKLKKDK